MKRESLIIGIAGLILGFILGIVTPKLFGQKQEALAPPPPQAQQQKEAHEGPTPSQIEHAVKEYKAALEKDPKNVTLLMELGGVYYAGLKFNDAIDAYRKVLEVDPKNADAYVQLGNLHYDNKRPKEAIEHYQKALEIKPNMGDVQVDMGTMFRLDGQPDRAIEEYRKVIAYDPMHANAHINLGVTLKADKKDNAGAIEAWKNLLKVITSGPKAEEAKARIAEAEKDLAEEQKGK